MNKSRDSIRRLMRKAVLDFRFNETDLKDG